jgi:hypothetical protein
MLMTDPTDLDMTCASTVAMVAWGRTVENFLSHDKETPASLARALEADPDCALAWCAKRCFSPAPS